MKSRKLNRREFLRQMGWGLASLPLLSLGCTNDGGVHVGGGDQGNGPDSIEVSTGSKEILKAIPSSGQKISPIGMGTWITFNVGVSQGIMDKRAKVLAQFLKEGGGMVDSSPMYGSAEKVLGYCLAKFDGAKGGPDTSKLFSATKVWTSGEEAGIRQMENSANLWKLRKFDLMQIHNLVDWKTHLKTLRKMKENKEIRYLGITTSHGRRHGDFERIMKTEPLDFVQLTYNLTHRSVESRLLPLAKEKGIAVICNRPFDGGDLVKGIQKKGIPLPQWAKEIDCDNWPQFLLKFIISHPAVTCAIPATSQVVHMHENKGAGRGQLPDGKMRKKMIEYVESKY